MSEESLTTLSQLADRLGEIIADPSSTALQPDTAAQSAANGLASSVACSPTTTTTPSDRTADGAPLTASKSAPPSTDNEPRPERLAPLGSEEADPLTATDADEQLPVAPPDLQVRLNDDPTLGFCIYAKRAFHRGEVLFTERTALEATHHPDPRGVRNVYRYYSRMSPKRRKALHGSFPMLAWANGIDPFEAAEARFLIGSNVTTKGFVLDMALTAEDHMRMRPDMAILEEGEPASGWWLSAQFWLTGRKTRDALTGFFHAGGGGSGESGSGSGGRSKSASTSRTRSRSRVKTWRQRSHGSGSDDETDNDDAKSRRSFRSMGSHKSRASQRSSSHDKPTTADKEFAERETLKWFSRYAFRLKPGAAFTDLGGHQAAVYLLTDLLNHRCSPYQNCRVQTRVGYASVIAERDIAPGEEVTINYNKSVKDFECKGECCRQ